MNVWMLNHYALTPSMSGGTRHYDFAKELIEKGHHVSIIASSFHYSKFKDMKVYEDTNYIQEDIDGVDFVWLKTSPYYGNGFGRVKNMLSYMYGAIKIIPKVMQDNPDVVIGSSVHPFASYAGYVLAKKYNVPFVMEVRDLWPKTLIDMGMSKWHPFVLLLGRLEKFLYKKADKIITNLPYAYEYIEQFVPRDKVIWISNGVDIKRMTYVQKEETRDFTISYTGAIGIANNLMNLVEVANELKEHKDIKFNIVGDGTEREVLQEYVKKNQLDNVAIIGSVAKEKIPEILRKSDVLFFSLKDSPVFAYGISSNKLFDYMASGRVIIFSSNAKNNPIKEADAGITIEPNNLALLKNIILDVYNMSQEERNVIGYKIRKYVEVTYATTELAKKLEHELIEIIQNFKNGNK